MRLGLVFFLGLLLMAGPAAGQQDFSDYVESQRKRYSDFLQQRDKEFHSALREEWKEFRMTSGKAEDPEPKPQEVPEAHLAEEEEPPASTRDDRHKRDRGPSTISVDSPSSESGALEQPSEPSSEKDAVTVKILGHSPSFRIAPAWREIAPRGGGKKRISSFWKQFAGLKSQPVLDQLEERARELGLGDWGRLILTQRLARKVAGSSEKDTVRLLMWGWLLKQGMDVRVARSGQEVILLYHSGHKVYQVPYFHLQGQRYYVFGDADPSRIKTYHGDYSGKRKALSLGLSADITSKGAEAERTLRFRFQGSEYRVQLSLSKARIRFLDTFPQLPLHLYFQAQPSPVIARGLAERLSRAVSSMDEEEAVNFLLRFTQKAFSYQTDKEQFGEENYLYPEETLFYPASDCEDRAILFSVLVRKVLDLDLAALDYPGHVATALDLSLSGEGKAVDVRDRSLVVADPTYINAKVGMIMPGFADERPRVLPLWSAGEGWREAALGLNRELERLGSEL